MVRKNQCPNCFGDGFTGIFRFKECRLCKGDGIFPKMNSVRPPAPPPLQKIDTYKCEICKDTGRYDGYLINTPCPICKSKQKKIKSFEGFEVGDVVEATMNLHGREKSIGRVLEITGDILRVALSMYNEIPFHFFKNQCKVIARPKAEKKEVDGMVHTKPSVTNRSVKPVRRKFQIGDEVVNCKQGKFYGSKGRVEEIDSCAVYIRDQSGEVYKLGLSWVHGELKLIDTLNDDDSPTKPAHYGKLDVFTYIAANFNRDEQIGYHKASAIKYISRAGKKDGNPFEQDIAKAKVHLEELEKLGVEL